MKNRPLLSVCLIVLALVTLAVLRGEEGLIRELRPSPLEAEGLGGKTVLVQGQVYRTEPKAEYQAFYLKNNSIQYQKKLFQESKIIIYTDPELQVQIGNTVKVRGEVSLFEHARNPGNFDQKRYYQVQDIHAALWAKEVEVADAHVWKGRAGLMRFRRAWKEALVRALGEEDGATLGAMLLGEKSGMDQDVKALYQANGIGHILAISGLHLSFIGIGMYQILRRLTGSYLVGGVCGILFLSAYILMIGLTVSAVRALVMFLFRVGADMTGRHYDAPTALGTAAAVVLLWRPLGLYDGGFWLSFGAVLAILMVVPVLQGVKEQRNGRGDNHRAGEAASVRQGVKEQRNGRGDNHQESRCRAKVQEFCEAAVQGMLASAGINLALLPIVLYYFFEFPVYSFLLNLFVIPLMSALLSLGMAGSLFSLVILPLSGLCFGACRGILWLYKFSCNLALTLPGARLVTGRPQMWQIAVYYGILAIVLLLLRDMDVRKDTDERKSSAGVRGSVPMGDISIRKCTDDKFDMDMRKRRLRRRSLALVLGAAGMILLTFRFGEQGVLAVTVLDVGQGDGIFLRGPEGRTYLVDGGSSDVKKVGQYRIEPFLKSQGVGTLDYVLVSHGDNDHINGVEELIERQKLGVRIGTLVLPVQEVWDEALAGLAEKARSSGVRVVSMEAGQSIQEGGMTLTCIQPGDLTPIDIQPGEDGGGQEDAEPGNAGAGQEDTEPGNAGGRQEDVEPGNAASMVLAVRYGEFDMLLAGDVEGEGEEQLVRRMEEWALDGTWEVLKAAHHGSKNSSSEEFLQQMQPAYVLISAGRENRYGHPHPEAVERYQEAGSRIYSTQENGAVMLEVESGKRMRFGSIVKKSCVQ